jgi:hypothetical protein
VLAYLRGGEDAEHRGVQQVQAVGQAAVHSPHRVLKQLHTGTDTHAGRGASARLCWMIVQQI